MREPMEIIGFWDGNGFGFGAGIYPMPQDFVEIGWLASEKQLLIDYLNGGYTSGSYRGFSWCRFGCGAGGYTMGNRDMTDGTWVWPSGLVHYVQYHNVRLPEEFIKHCRLNNWEPRVSHFDESTYHQTSDKFWIKWKNDQQGQGGSHEKRA